MKQVNPAYRSHLIFRTNSEPPQVLAIQPLPAYAAANMSLNEILAEVDSLSPTELLILNRKIRERFESQGRTIGEVAGDLLDGVDDLPGDLNSNPKYMKDFGK
jgi:hypothetical protein